MAHEAPAFPAAVAQRAHWQFCHFNTQMQAKLPPQAHKETRQELQQVTQLDESSCMQLIQVQWQYHTVAHKAGKQNTLNTVARALRRHRARPQCFQDLRSL